MSITSQNALNFIDKEGERSLYLGVNQDEIKAMFYILAILFDFKNSEKNKYSVEEVVKTAKGISLSKY